jgi:hypothetical protein
MENFELTIAVGVVVLVYKDTRITVLQKDLDSPFSFEFTLDGNAVHRKTKTKALHTVARLVREAEALQAGG